MPTGQEDRLRCDAARNRERVLSAALAVYGERGPSFTMEEVAARAGVGIGTVYRRFPTRAALLDAIALPWFERMLELAREAAAGPDPAGGVEAFIRAVVAEHFTSRIRSGRLWDAAVGQPVRQQIMEVVDPLIAAGRSAGRLRDDLSYQDVSVLLWTLGALIDATDAVAPQIWRRHLELALDALRPGRADPDATRDTPPLTAADWIRLVSATPVLRLR